MTTEDEDLPPTYLHAEIDGEAIHRDKPPESVAMRNDAAENGYEINPKSPLSWMNSARMIVDEAEDSVSLLVSVGDPRGAFCMTVRRKDDGTIVLHVPHEKDSMPHMDLKDIGHGTLVVK